MVGRLLARVSKLAFQLKYRSVGVAIYFCWRGKNMALEINCHMLIIRSASLRLPWFQRFIFIIFIAKGRGKILNLWNQGTLRQKMYAIYKVNSSWQILRNSRNIAKFVSCIFLGWLYIKETVYKFKNDCLAVGRLDGLQQNYYIQWKECGTFFPLW
jgi:hypothetical protein